MCRAPHPRREGRPVSTDLDTLERLALAAQAAASGDWFDDSYCGVHSGDLSRRYYELERGIQGE